ncbi:MAG: zinc ribbon domain-containing protein [Coleofasciculus sp. C2-GNP5-27]
MVDRWYPSTKTCSRCQTEKDSMPLSERVFRCDNCVLEIDRDFNASINFEIAAS